jgi:NADPH-dependent 2,4-dienoyl-CoA reductase/sulfur reductase-like enzyme
VGDQDGTDRLVVVGTGIAGVSVVAAARLGGFEGEVVLLGDEPELPYRRPPVSKEVVRGAKSADDIRIRKAEWYEQQRVDLRTGTEVTALDVERRVVTLASGEELGYGSLVLATGGRARTLDDLTTPAGAEGVRTLRTLADVDGVVGALAPGAHLLVVGAGLIGSEIAASAREVGAQVTLLEAAEAPLLHLLPPGLAASVAGLHAEHGTDLQTGVDVVSIDADPAGGTVVTASDGRRWSAPVVVVAVGMVPRGELAADAGLRTERGAVVVDDRGRTSAPDVYAVGDVALRPSPLRGGPERVEHWQGAQNHGTAIGKVLAGQDAPFDEVPWCWSDQYGHTLQVTGWPSADHELVVRGSLDERDFTAFLLDDGVLRGAVTIGRPAEVRLARQWIAARARPSVDALAGADDLATAVEAGSP